MNEGKFSRTARSFEKWGVRLAAALTFVMGCVNLLSAVQPALSSRLTLIENLLPLEVRHGSRITSALAGFGLLLLAGSLWRRKRVSWILTVILLVISIASHLGKGLDIEESALALALLVLLVFLRGSFHAESDRPSVRQGLLTLAGAFVFTLIYGTLGFYLLDHHFSIRFNFLEAVRQTVVMFTAFYDPGLEPLTRFGRYFADSIYIIGMGTFGFAALMLARPVLARLPAPPDERQLAGRIVNSHGRTSLARAVLFDDKLYAFYQGDTVIGYAVGGRGAMALGDPIGPAENMAGAIANFRDVCARNDWSPSFVSILPDYLDLYRAAGFQTLCIGYEAIVDLAGFTLEGSQNKDLRNAVNRMARNGYETRIFAPPLDDGLVHGLHEISDAWLSSRKGAEMHFSDGWFEENYIRSGPAAVILDGEKKPVAFANLVPEYQKNELTIDLMRHYPGPVNGTMEFLFTSMLDWAKQGGYASFSLGLSAVVGVGEKPEDPQVEKAVHAIAGLVSRFYNFKGLHKFKEKFHPHWEPRYLAYPGAASLPQVVDTLLRVHSGGSYLPQIVRR